MIDGRGRPEAATVLAIGASVAFPLALAAVAYVAGPRGTDQFWYLADAQTLVETGRAVSTTVFPAAVLAGTELPPPFLHATLSVFTAAVPTALLGPLGGWLALNVVSTLVAAGAIYIAAGTVTGRAIALLAAVAWLALPLTLWLTAQPLVEPSSAALAAVALAIFARARDRLGRWLALALVLVALVLTRTSYVVLLPLIPVAYLVERDRRRSGGGWTTAVPGALLIAAVTAAAMLMGDAAIGREQVEFSAMRLLHSAIPGATDNMWFNLAMSPANVEDRLPFRPELLPIKLAANVETQLTGGGVPTILLFFWSANVLAIGALVGLWRVRRDPRRRLLLLAALVPFGVHLLTLTLFQNQVRYLLPAVPGLLAGTAVAVASFGRPRRWLEAHARIAVALVVAVALAPAVLVGRQLWVEGRAAAATEALAAAAIDERFTDSDHGVIVYAEAATQVLGHAARPRLTLYVYPDAPATDLSRVLERFPARWVLAPEQAPVLEHLSPGGPDLARIGVGQSVWVLRSLSGEGTSSP